MSFSPDVEHEWFNKWTATAESKLELYKQLFEDLFLRPAEIQYVVDLAVRKDILRDARRNNAEEWRQVLALLRSSEPLSGIIGKLFGDEIPVSVALIALESMLRDEDDNITDVEISNEFQRRGAERTNVAKPTFLWVIEIAERGIMNVIVKRRSELASPPTGLVMVTDARQVM